MNTIAFEITDKCNHNCLHCIKSWREKEVGSMSKENIDLISKMDTVHFIINGGEPGLEKDLVFYFISIVKDSIISLNTNLSLWTDNEILSLLDKKVHINISDNFDIAKPYLKKYNRYITLQKLIIDYSIPYDHYIKDSNITLGVPIPTSNFEPNIDYCREVYLLAKKFNKLGGNIKNFLPMPLCWDIPELGTNHSCIAGTNRIMITPDGTIRPCGCIPNHIIGNLKDGFKSIIIEKPSKCNDCSLKSKCNACKGYLSYDKLLKPIL